MGMSDYIRHIAATAALAASLASPAEVANRYARSAPQRQNAAQQATPQYKAAEPYILSGAFYDRQRAENHALALKNLDGDVVMQPVRKDGLPLTRVMVRYEEQSAQRIIKYLESQGMKPFILMKENGVDKFTNLEEYVKQQSARVRPGSTADPYTNLPYHSIMHAAVESSAATYGKSAQARNFEGMMYGLMMAESSGDEQAVSPCGALGLMQNYDLEDILDFFPEKKRVFKQQMERYEAGKAARKTGQPVQARPPKYPALTPKEQNRYRLARQEELRPNTNIRKGVERYFECLDHLHEAGIDTSGPEGMKLGLAAYNAGPGYVIKKWRQNAKQRTHYARAQSTIGNSYRETRNHVDRVMKLAKNYSEKSRGSL